MYYIPFFQVVQSTKDDIIHSELKYENILLKMPLDT